jgi:undecaprenyl-phosphate 4-deoxy-4-formamido-L-arabinose transferase
LLPGISVVVPVYNSSATLPDLVERLQKALESTGRRFEAVLVNDGSRDDSWQTIERLGRGNPWLHGVDLMRNYGQENALLCGIRAAFFDVVVTIDDDLQNPPEEIFRMVAKLEEGFDLVYGTPAREQHGLFRDWASLATKAMIQHVMMVRGARQVTAFKAFRTALRDAFAHYRNPHVSIDILLTWGTDRIGALTVRHDPRSVGRSNFGLMRLVGHALNMITGFSGIPLRLAGIMGLLFSLLGVGVLVFVVVDYFVRGDPVPGFPFLAGIIAIFSGAQMLALGIIGEYLARVHLHSLGREPYAVRRSTSEAPRYASARPTEFPDKPRSTNTFSLPPGIKND